MTEMPPTTPLDPTPPPPSSPRKLTRSTEDRMVAGVAGGLARHFDLDPLLFRIGFAVLALFGGSGIALYLLLAVFVPSDDPGAESGKSRTALLFVLGLAVIISLPIAIPAAVFLAPVLVLVAIGALVYRAAGGQIDPRAVRASVVVLVIVGAVFLGLGAATAVAFGAGTAVAVAVLAAGVVLVAGAFAG
jgi:phage shock protein PspC (stress-responsive transcriptional regulator)